jgi:hypothetical protein
MRRRGLIQANGQWISREEYQARVRAQEEEAARRYAVRQEAARAAREDRLAALAELSVVRQLAQPTQQAPNPYSIYGVPFYGYGAVVVTPGFGGGGHHRPPHGQGPPGFTHIPGSLIPGSLVPESN